MNWYLAVLKKYAVFEGRARRKEYWFFTLFNIIIAIVLGIIDSITGTFNPATGMGVLGGLYALAILIPGLAVTVRRLHDTGRSGWWILINLIPIVGGIVMLVFLIQDSQPGPNQYGANPKDVSEPPTGAPLAEETPPVQPPVAPLSGQPPIGQPPTIGQPIAQPPINQPPPVQPSIDKPKI